MSGVLGGQGARRLAPLRQGGVEPPRPRRKLGYGGDDVRLRLAAECGSGGADVDEQRY